MKFKTIVSPNVQPSQYSEKWFIQPKLQPNLHHIKCIPYTIWLYCLIEVFFYLASSINFSGSNMQSFAVGNLEVVSIIFIGSTFSVISYTTPNNPILHWKDLHYRVSQNICHWFCTSIDLLLNWQESLHLLISFTIIIQISVLGVRSKRKFDIHISTFSLATTIVLIRKI